MVIEDWPELEELVEQLRSENAEGWQRTQQLREQLTDMQGHLDLLARQTEELRISEHLQALNDRLLGGLGSLESAQSVLGIERVVALAWPSEMHPRHPQNMEETETAEADAQRGMFRIEVWLGPGLHDGRARIRISGTKRLEAALPTSPARFRAALLAVFRNPLFTAMPAADEPEPDEETDGDRESIENAIADGEESTPDLTDP